MMPIHDVTVALRPGMFVYPGEAPFETRRTASFATGQSWNGSAISTSVHNGTHLDAPYHYFEKGKRVHEIGPDVLLGPCEVVEVRKKRSIEAGDLRGVHLGYGCRVLFKTRNSGFWRRKRFRKDFTYIGASAARLLARRGASLVGIDYLSAERFGITADPAHKALLGAGCVILEGIDLSRVEPGLYDLLCCPLKIQGGDGAPARVFLVSP